MKPFRSALLVGGAGVFGEEFRGESEVVLVAGGDEVAEDGMGLQRLGLEFRMKLAAQEEGMCWNFNDFDVGGVGGGAGDAEASAGEDGFVLAVELVAVAVAFAYLCDPVGLSGEGAGFEDAVPGAEAHSAAHLFDASQLTQFVDDAVRACGVELARGGLLEVADVSGVRSGLA